MNKQNVTVRKGIFLQVGVSEIVVSGQNGASNVSCYNEGGKLSFSKVHLFVYWKHNLH